MAPHATNRIKQETTLQRRQKWTGSNKKIGSQEPNRTSPQLHNKSTKQPLTGQQSQVGGARKFQKKEESVIYKP
jgi:hypothetical protein